jgi:hypothetical protein
VIGAGPAGIAVAAALSSRQLDVVVVDQHTDVGGLWDPGNPGSACRGDVSLVTPASLMGYDGIPLDAKRAFPSQKEVLDYLRDVAATNVPPEAYRLGVSVQTCRRDSATGLWNVELSSGAILTAHSVVACTGSFWNPNIPSDWGLQCRGSWIHSRDFCPGDIRQGERLRVVGAGNSAADVARSAHRAGAEIWLDWRSTPWFLPRFVEGVPAETVPLKLDGVARPLRGIESQRQLALRATSTLCRFEAISGGRRPSGLPYEGPTIIGDELLSLLEKEERVWLWSDHQRKPSFDLTVLATGYSASDSCLSEVLLTSQRDIASLTFKEQPGLYWTGNIVAERGGFWLFSLMANAISESIENDLRSNGTRVAAERRQSHETPCTDVLWGMRVSRQGGPQMVFSDAYIEAVTSTRTASRVSAAKPQARLVPLR